MADFMGVLLGDLLLRCKPHRTSCVSHAFQRRRKQNKKAAKNTINLFYFSFCFVGDKNIFQQKLIKQYVSGSARLLLPLTYVIGNLLDGSFAIVIL